ncbi:hypothetical protein SCP_1202770 [Sparassis crispa]|uniref:Uncharacterized protein n=1 Tax=Sparassis crispa TaxID=139825 RepID=A0A401H0V3_9APHY|nr:hypothetical protein SCP_1202770 [Sparassis crispa]GBE88048.1 hypothetical protein SCP_1202770 [Sparassis crispa]
MPAPGPGSPLWPTNRARTDMKGECILQYVPEALVLGPLDPTFRELVDEVYRKQRKEAEPAFCESLQVVDGTGTTL